MVLHLLTGLYVEPHLPENPFLQQRWGKSPQARVNSERNQILWPSRLEEDGSTGVQVEHLHKIRMSRQ